MGKIVVSEFVSLDGVMEAPGGEPGHRHTGWVHRLKAPEQYQYNLDEVLAHERLFDESHDPTTLKLTDTLTMTNGAVVLTYQPARGA